MNETILQNLALIKWLSIANLVLFSYVALFMTISVISARRSNQDKMELVEERAIFFSEIAELYESERFKKCIGLCEKRIENYKNDPTPHWYIAISNRKL